MSFTFQNSILVGIIGFVFYLFPLSLWSQSIIHIENRRLAAVDTGFTGTAEMSANFIQNINDIFQTVNAAQIQYSSNPVSLISLSTYNLTVFNGNNIVNEGFQHFRFQYKHRTRLFFEAFSQYQFNEIIKINSRYLNGLGMRYKAINRDSVKFFSGTVLMREIENETTGIQNKHWRLSQYLSFGFPITPQIFVDIISYYQPDIVNFKDFRSSTEAIFDLRISRRLSLRLVHSLFYDTKPPEGIRTMFYNFRNGFSYRF